MAVGVFRVASRLAPMVPDQVRRQRFRRTGFGRRGLVEAHVYAFLHRVVDELIARDRVEASLREENARLKNALRDWQGGYAPRPGQMDGSAWTGDQQRR
ncbi:DivIVA domain-containing protein [Micromonospora sp. NBC_01392]|uniref:DivIVA domain-containing protein n=1 Tax=unclassified Micromonospora TaxID=2617518 RepID=UPI00325140CB